MKFLSSSSPSSAASTITTTTTTSISFNGNICKYCRTPNVGCLSGMLRQFLCFNNPPTHPSDQFRDTDMSSREFDKLGCLETEEKVGVTTNPGIVARLMGLEFVPQANLANTQITPNSIARSRSMNYDSLGERESPQGQHRRVKISLSFRELPTFLELENEQFFVLSFENGGGNKEVRSKAHSSEKSSGKLKRRKGERCRSKCDTKKSAPDEDDKENQEPNKVVSKDASYILCATNNCNQYSRIATEAVKQSKPINHIGKQRKEKEENVSAVKTESNSENSSPVSVLEFGESIIDLQVPTSEDDPRSTDSNSRRKLAAQLENYEHSPPSQLKPRSSSTSDVQKRKLIDGKCRGSKTNDYQRPNYVEMWGEICKMAEGAMIESNLVYRELWKLDDIRGMGAVLGLQILGTLLNELVDQLVTTSYETIK